MGQTTTDNGAAAAGAVAAFAGLNLIISIAVLAFFVICFWKIFQKAGFNGALALLMFVPCVNIIMIAWFAFTDWPALKGGYGGGASGPTNYYRPPDQGAPPPSAPTG